MNSERHNIYSASKIIDYSSSQAADSMTTPITTPRSANNVPLTFQVMSATATAGKNAAGFLVPISENDKVAKSARGAPGGGKKNSKGRKSQRASEGLQLTTVKGLLHVEGESLPGNQARVKWDIREEDEGDDDVMLATSAGEGEEAAMTVHQSRAREKRTETKPRRLGNTPR